MNDEEYEKIRAVLKVEFSIVNRNLDTNILSLKTKFNAEGMLNSGRYPVQLNELLLNYIQEVCNIVWKESFGLIKANLIGVEVEDISNVINELTSESIDLAEERLKREVTIGNPERILKELDFTKKAKEILEKKISESELNLRAFFKEEHEKLDTFRLARSGKNISVCSLVLSTLISLAALIVSIIALKK